MRRLVVRVGPYSFRGYDGKPRSPNRIRLIGSFYFERISSRVLLGETLRPLNRLYFQFWSGAFYPAAIYAKHEGQPVKE